MNLSWQQAIGIDQTYLVECQSGSKNYLIHPSIQPDLALLLSAAKSDDVPIATISSYRSFEQQLSIWNEKWQGYRPVFSRHGRPLNITQMSDMEKYKAISLWSALPGLSRHHWGTDLDIFSADAIKKGHKVELIPEEFALTGVCCELNDWLDKNLSKYGFFRPYQNYQQGVSAEAWHISHIAISEQIQKAFPFKQCSDYLGKSDICSSQFIADRFDHYCSQYFNNICQPPVIARRNDAAISLSDTGSNPTQ